MKYSLVFAFVASLALTGCLQSDPEDEGAAFRAQQAALATAAPAVAAEAGMPESLLEVVQFSVQDPSGQSVGIYRNTGGEAWVGPDLINGGDLQWVELFRLADQILIEAVRPPGAGGQWDIYELSIQLSGRVYIAFKQDENDDWHPIPDHMSIDLIAR